MCEVPAKPFFLQEGKYKGHAVETLIFHNPAVVVGLSKNGPRELSRHIDSLFKFGENLSTLPFCFCGQHRVKNFTIKDGLICYDLMSCDQTNCVDELIQKIGHGGIYPIKLSTLNLFRNDVKQQEKVGVFLKNILGLSRNASPEMILSKITGGYSVNLV